MKNKIKFFIKNFEEIVCGTFITVMVSIVITNVISRYFFNSGIYWAEEVATISFVWSVFVGASATYKHKMNIGIDFLIKKGSVRFQKLTQLVVDVMLLIITGYILYLSLVFTKASAIKPTAVLGVSSVVVNGALVVGFGLMTIHAIRFLYQDILKFIKNNEEKQFVNFNNKKEVM